MSSAPLPSPLRPSHQVGAISSFQKEETPKTLDGLLSMLKTEKGVLENNRAGLDETGKINRMISHTAETLEQLSKDPSSFPKSKVDEIGHLLKEIRELATTTPYKMAISEIPTLPEGTPDVQIQKGKMRHKSVTIQTSEQQHSFFFKFGEKLHNLFYGHGFVTNEKLTSPTLTQQQLRENIKNIIREKLTQLEARRDLITKADYPRHDDIENLVAIRKELNELKALYITGDKKMTNEFDDRITSLERDFTDLPNHE